MRLIDADALKSLILSRRKAAKTLTGIDLVMVIDYAPTIDAIPIKPLSVWLAVYAAPPKYALEAICNDIDPASIAYTANDRARAWEYHIKQLMECGLMEEEHDARKTDT